MLTGVILKSLIMLSRTCIRLERTYSHPKEHLNLDWPTYVAGWSWHRADNVCLTCHASGPIWVNPGECRLEYGTVIHSALKNPFLISLFRQESISQDPSGVDTDKILKDITAEDYILTGQNAGSVFSDVAATWKQLNWSRVHIQDSIRQSVKFGTRLLDKCQVGIKNPT